jgi:serine/threonine protein kinase/WD40 repeat protein/tetratricopeptide (TPR) repeat protein
MVPSSSSKYELLDQLAEEFADRYRRGQRPSLHEYLDRHPNLADEICDLFPALAEVEQAEADRPEAERHKPEVKAATLLQVGDYRILRKIGEGGMGVVYEAEQVSLGRRVALKVLSRQAISDARAQARFRREARSAARLHHTNIVPVFEVGQEGDVCYYAMQLIQGQGLDQVVLEVRRLRARSGANPAGMQPAAARSPAPAAHPQRSGALSQVAQSLLSGCLDAPTLATNSSADPASRVGPEGEVPPDSRDLPALTATSALANGRTSLSGIEARHGPYFRSVARVGQQTALALAHAHARGIVHRDIKPSNLLLDESGVIWVTDFGLAKTEEDNLTRTGDLPGTLRYMSPERFEGQCDVRADVYALGLTLYELLVLAPAFAASDRLKLLEQIRNHAPARPRALDHRVPRDLETVVLKAIDKDPRLRYQSSDELAEDLRRFLADEPIQARRTRLPERLVRWCRHNQAVAGLLAMVAVVLLLGTGIAWFFALKANANAEQAREEKRHAQTAERGRREQLLEALMAEARAKRYSGRIGQRYGTIEAVRKATRLARELGKPREVFDELRSLAVAALALPDFRVAAKTWDGWPEGSFGLDFDPVALRQYARGDRHGNISVRRLEDDREVARLPGTGSARAIIFGADGRTLLLHDSKSGALERWTIGGPPPKKVATITNDVCLWQQSRDGRRLLALHHTPQGTRAEVIELPSGKPCFEHRSPTHDNGGTLTRWRAALSPDGKSLALADGVYGSPQRNRLLLFNLDTGQLAGELPSQQAFAPAWHPDSRTLAVGKWDNGVNLWDAPTGKLLRTLTDLIGGEPHPAMSLSGQLLTSVSGWNGGQVFWHPHTGKPLLRTPFGYSVTRTVQDGRQYEATIDKTRISLHIVEPSPVFRTLVSNGGCYEVSVHPGGRLLAVGQGYGVSLFDLPTGLEIGRLDVGGTVSVRFDLSNGDLLTYNPRGLFRWPVRITPGSPDAVVVGPPRLLGPGNFTGFDLSQDGKVSAVAHFTHAVIYRQEGPRLRAITLGPLTDTRAVRLSPDGRWALTLTFPTGDGLLWDAQTGRQVAQVQQASGLVFTRDSRWLTDGRRRLEASTGKQGPAVPTADGPKVQVLSPDGALFAGQSNAEAVDLVQTATGKTLVQLGLPEQSRTACGTFSRDGTQLIQQSVDYFYVYAWDLRALRGHLADLGLDWDASPLPPAPEAGSPLRPTLEVELGNLLQDPEALARRLLELTLEQLDYQVEAVRKPAEEAALRTRRGILRGRLALWKPAAADFARAIQLNPAGHLSWFDLAGVLLWLGDRDGHRNHCREMLRRFRRTTNPYEAERTAKACLIVPGTVADPEQLVRLTEQALVGTATQWGNPWFLQSRGLAEYRAGRPQEAITWIQKGQQRFKTAPPGYTAFGHLVLSLAYQQLKEGENARQALAEAERIIDHELPQESSGDVGPCWVDWVFCRVLRREAEGLLKKD